MAVFFLHRAARCAIRDTGGCAAGSRTRERSLRHKIRSMPRKPHPQDSRLSAVSPSRATAFTQLIKSPTGISAPSQLITPRSASNGAPPARQKWPSFAGSFLTNNKRAPESKFRCSFIAVALTGSACQGRPSIEKATPFQSKISIRPEPA